MTAHLNPAPQQTRAFYAAAVPDFLSADTNTIVGQLASRQSGFHSTTEASQLRAWEREISILKSALIHLGETGAPWSLLLEVPLLRLGKRLDAVVLAPGVVVVIEFKIGADVYDTSSRTQAERYAWCLRDFHEASQASTIIPILCAENAPARPVTLVLVENVADVLTVNASDLTSALRLVIPLQGQNALTVPDFDKSAYRPTPTIVEAAQALYAGHRIADIGRGDAADTALQLAADRLAALAKQAETSSSHFICFVTGSPGAGKTLLGLDLALRGRGANRPAALLSGNRPLVHVLTEALAQDHADRTGSTKDHARHQTGAAIQNLLGYLREHTDGAAPPEHVIIFDEAQRAWDEEVGRELMDRPQSEPELFLEILNRLEWSCLVCLVGPGQEINRGEGGLSLWGQALSKSAAQGKEWTVFAAPQAIDGGADVVGPGLATDRASLPRFVEREPVLHLKNAIRAYRNPLHGAWVVALLDGRIADAAHLSAQMAAPPAFLTRDLDAAKVWLKARRRGGRSVGLLTSSGAVRLIADGVAPAPRSNELGPIGHWFLKNSDDFRGAGALELPMSEFGCQGLEVDYAGICWGNDLIWDDGNWVPRTMRAPKWQTIRDGERKRFRINGYRVLLTRARAGTIIFVPGGSNEDPSRSPGEFNQIAKTLQSAGCKLFTL